jgi:hypothetical protein
MKMRKFADEGFVREGPNANIDDDTRERARKSVADDVAPAKPKVVTKEELAKSGLSLRDYMNKQQGLTRRKDFSPTPNAYGKEQQYQRASEAAQTPAGKAKRSAMAEAQALEGSYPAENIAGGAAGLLKSGIGKLLGRGAAKEATRVEPYLAKEAEQLALPAPTRQLGYDKAGAKAAERNARTQGRQDEMSRENLRRYGMTDDTSRDAVNAVRDNLGMGRGFKVMKKGGSAKGYASGGSVSSRGDGIAQRGKTRGRMC